LFKQSLAPVNCLMPWKQLSVDVVDTQSDVATAVLEDAGALSVTLLDAADELLIEPVPGSSPLWKKVRIIALFAADFEPAGLQQQLREMLHDSQLEVRVEKLADRDWSTTWRDSFPPMCFGRRLWVCPTGAACPQDDAVVVRLDPGNAFGTGTHATTAMCLEWLDRHPPRGQTVIDYGCGSGILAIAAAKLGAAAVHAIDIDVQALAASRDNARLNGIHSGFTVRLPVDFDPPRADLVIANILANPLQELAGELAGMLRPGGTILLTGILAEQADAVMTAYQPWIDFDAPLRREQWVLLTGTKSAGR
jgi:ribosomal protein L11 methyltransferase